MWGVKMRNKLLIIIAILFIMIGCSKEKNIPSPVPTTTSTSLHDTISLMNFGVYKNFSINNVKFLNISKYTEAGIDDKKISDINEIKSIYETLSKYKIGEITESSCDDNTTIYSFTMNDGSTVVFEFECNWIVIDNVRYMVEMPR